MPDWTLVGLLAALTPFPLVAALGIWAASTL